MTDPTLAIARRLTLAVVLILLFAAAGCLGPTPTPPLPTPTVTPVALDPEIEVFAWGMAAGEAEALAALAGVFEHNHPGVRFVDAAAGAGATATLIARLQAQRPPDSWQGHAGQEMAPYADAGLLEPVDFLFEQYGWTEALPSQLLPLIRHGGNLYAVPVGIHRTNVLWSNPRLLAQNGIAPPTTQPDFLAALQALKAAGMEAPLALAEPWTDTHLFETLLLAALGPQAYTGLWTGATDWNATEVAAAIAQFAALLAFSNADAAGLTWEQAAQRLADGQAAFLIMGDWADGYFRRQGLEPGQDYAWRPAPGTDGAFQFLADSFVLPVGAPHRAAAVAWLTLVGSQAGQDAFNPIAGSIPARRDADRRRYSPYQQDALSDWATDVLVGSLTHGVVATAEWQAEITLALEQFRLANDADVLQATLANICSHTGPCP